MRRHSAFWAFALLFTVLGSVQAAERETTVFIFRLSGDGGEAQYRYQDLPAAARFLFPVSFTARSGRVEINVGASTGLLERERTVLAKRPAGTLERVSLLLAASVLKSPRPGRTVSLSFTLDELLAKGGVWSTVPAAWACYSAAQGSGWASGSVWARSMAYDARTGRFTVKVSLSR